MSARKFNVFIMLKKNQILGLCLIIACLLSLPVLAQDDLVVLYTGASYGAIYPDYVDAKGGILNREALILKEKQENPELLLLDVGNFSAGGSYDPVQLEDKEQRQRSAVVKKVLSTLPYDAVGIAENDISGVNSLSLSDNLNYVASNVKSKFSKVSIVKSANGLDVAILGVVPENFQNYKLKVSNPIKTLAKEISSLEKSGVDVFIVFSSLGFADTEKMISKIPAIDMVVLDKPMFPFFEHKRIGDTVVVSPFFLAKKIGKVVFSFEGSRVKNYKFSALDVTKQTISSSSLINDIPACFRNTDCMPKTGMNVQCKKPGLDSQCVYSKIADPEVTVLNIKDCAACDTSVINEMVKKNFPGIKLTEVDYREPEAQELIEKYKIGSLPAYKFNDSIVHEPAFKAEQNYYLRIQDSYFLHPVYSGIFYFLDREEKKGRIDFFVDLFAENSSALLQGIDKIKGNKDVFVHLIYGNKVVAHREEVMRLLAIESLYPQKYDAYLKKRLENDINSSYWAELLNELEIPVKVVSDFARSAKGQDLLNVKLSLAKELQISHSGVVLIDNRRIFSVANDFSDDLKEYLK